MPDELKELFELYIPKAEIRAGAGAVFDELTIVRFNEDLPAALRSRLFIVGSAPNGDHIAVDLNDGRTGYISHEHDWQQNPREFFIAVSPSLGCFLRDVNGTPPMVPEDYWAAQDERN